MSDRSNNDGALSSHTLEKVKKAKVSIETFYSNLVNQQIERDDRMQTLEKAMQHEGLTEEEVSFIKFILPDE